MNLMMYTIVEFNNKIVPTMMLHNVHQLYEGFIYVHIEYMYIHEVHGIFFSFFD